jgi:hypothetical protein
MKAHSADGEPAAAAPWNLLNPLVALSPTMLETGLLRCPDGVERMIVTVKHPAGECTVMLGWADAELWLATLAETHARQSRVTAAAQIPGQAELPHMPGNGHGGPR